MSKYAGQRTNQSKRVSITTTIILIITFVVLALIVYSKLDAITGLFTPDNSYLYVNESKLHIQESITTSGTILDDGDVINYSHTLESTKYGKLGLKSQNISLVNYEGNVEIHGIITHIKNGIPILEVEKIYNIQNEDFKEELEDETPKESSIEYIKDSLIRFPEAFYEEHKLNAGDRQIIVENKSGDKLVTIDYFDCKTDGGNQDCNYLQKIFGSYPEDSASSSYGVTFNKLSEINSRFSHNGIKGYYINDTPKENLKNVIKDIISPNERYFNNFIKPEISTYCKQDYQAMQSMSDYIIYTEGGNIYTDIIGSGSQVEYIDCTLIITPEKITLESIEITDINRVGVDESNASETHDLKIDDNAEPIYEDIKLEQFPVKLEKAISFESRRGHTITFPSPNIAYAETNVQVNFEQDGVSCRVVMNVVEYSNKLQVTNKPRIKIYECSIQNGFNASAKELIYLHPNENKHFIIQVVDPARYDFANNLKIEIR